MKIIVADDEIAALSTFLMHVVDEFDIEYKMFRDNPLSAPEYAARVRADAAFLDINMPAVNGVDLAEMLIAAKRDIKIVFISGYAQDEGEIRARLGANLVGFCYKPYSEERLLEFCRALRDESDKGAHIRTFGAFDLFVFDSPVRFACAKSKELLALLTEKNGAHISMNEAISYLWPDKNPDFAKRLYRDAVCRMRITLKKCGLENLVHFYRAELAVNKEAVCCDLWDALATGDLSKFSGQYMPQYDWSVEMQSHLEILKEKS